MNLQDNQFLRIKSFDGFTDFEIIELQPPKRPKRWHIEVQHSQIVNRHKREYEFRGDGSLHVLNKPPSRIKRVRERRLNGA